MFVDLDQGRRDIVEVLEGRQRVVALEYGGQAGRRALGVRGVGSGTGGAAAAASASQAPSEVCRTARELKARAVAVLGLLTRLVAWTMRWAIVGQ